MIDAIVNWVIVNLFWRLMNQLELVKMQNTIEYMLLHVLGIMKTQWLGCYGVIERICDLREKLLKTCTCKIMHIKYL